MPSLSQELQADLIAAVEAEFGEEIVYTQNDRHAYVVTNKTEDGAGAPRTMIAVVRVEGNTTSRNNQGVSDPSPRFSVEQCEAAIAARYFDQEFQRPRIGDTITLTERDGQPSFRIAGVLADGKGRFSCTMTRTAAAL